MELEHHLDIDIRWDKLRFATIHTSSDKARELNFLLVGLVDANAATRGAKPAAG
jgi:hypothetical protein